MKNLPLALLLLLGLLYVRGQIIAEMTYNNLTFLSNLQAIATKDLSQIICRDNSQQMISSKVVSVPQIRGSHQKLVNAAWQAYFSGDCNSALMYWNLAAAKDSRNSVVSMMRYLSSGLDRLMFPSDTSKEEMATFLYGLGRIAEQEQMEEQALFWFAHSFELQPSRSVAVRLTAMQRSPEENESTWQELADSLNENDADYWWALGHYAELQQEWRLALQAYSRGEMISSEPYDFLIQQGGVYTQLELWDKAVIAYQRASELEPRSVTPYLELGNIYREQRDFETAKAWYEMTLERHNSNFAAIYYLGVTHYELKNDDLAKKYLQRALVRTPTHAASAYYMAQTLNRSDDPQDAMGYLERALSSKETKPWRWLVQLGDWRCAEGDIEGALIVYKEALELQPADETLRNKIKAIEDVQ